MNPAFNSQLWAYDQEHFAPLVRKLEEEAKWTLERDKDGWLELVDKPIISVENGVATISISGPLMRKPSLYMQVIGEATDFLEIEAAIAQAGNDPSVKTVMLDVDSPGGTVNGTAECAAAIAELAKKKFVYAYTGGMMCSAAYWLASQCNAIYCTSSASVGSIGVILAFADVSKMYADMGVKMEVLTSGKHKGAGTPGTSLSDEQRELLQARIDEMGADFRAAVTARGRKIPADAMEGQVFSGKGAQKVNLAGLTKSRGEVMTRLLALKSARVDTTESAMDPNKTAEENLAAALEKITALESTAVTNATASAEKLATAEANVKAAEALVAEEAVKVATITAERDAVQAKLEIATKANDDFAAKVAKAAASIAAKSGADPLEITPGADDKPKTPKAKSREDLYAEMAALPQADQRAFYLENIKGKVA